MYIEQYLVQCSRHVGPKGRQCSIRSLVACRGVSPVNTCVCRKETRQPFRTCGGAQRTAGRHFWANLSNLQSPTKVVCTAFYLSIFFCFHVFTPYGAFSQYWCVLVRCPVNSEPGGSLNMCEPHSKGREGGSGPQSLQFQITCVIQPAEKNKTALESEI